MKTTSAPTETTLPSIVCPSSKVLASRFLEHAGEVLFREIVFGLLIVVFGHLSTPRYKLGILVPGKVRPIR